MKLHRLTDPLTGLERRLTHRHGRASGVLLISAGGLGDTVLFALVAERFAALAEPGETVTVLLRSNAAEMAFLLPPSINVLTVDFVALRHPAQRRRYLDDLYRRHYRLVVSTDFQRHPDLDEALAFACSAPESAAMVPRPWAKYNRRLTANRKRWGRLIETGPETLDNKLLRWAAFADALTGRSLPPPRVALSPERLAAQTPPDPIVADKPTVVIQPFSAVRGKQSPPDLFRQIIETLPSGWRVRISGHPSDFERCPEYRPLLDLEGVSFEPMPFAQLVGVLRAARLVISVDTGCMHLAAALGTPTLCLASAAYVGGNIPYVPALGPTSARFIWTPMACQGCLGDCRRPAVDSMYPCVAALPADVVMRAVADMTETLR
ncbi:glycosyltransferase family 9 protein [Magnetospirillum molischianum]|uniref:ADP-heptose:LPS heptosyltransferase n=1 Tax=Magnetospirillum molischianum DSM 120 TaxID=1150626 RepID=H8FU77_MAGML|nr:glycosyltransferase family 9 protein [Magnetospirillum molischianum]CCG41915.1 conserved hypothetical protein [Magnetospirillum molischianum DSM 120]